MTTSQPPPAQLTCVPLLTRPVPLWADLPPEIQRLLVVYFESDDYGRLVQRAARHDHNYAVWLTALSGEFTLRCGHPPADLAEPRWRGHYIDGRTPAAAVRLDLHHRPMARIDDELVCPVCDTGGQIWEQDSATRHHELSVQNARIVASENDHLFELDRYFCGSCDTTVQLPEPIDVAR